MRKQQLLQRLRSLDFISAHSVLTAAVDGAVNQNFRLDSEGQSYFVKSFQQGSFAAVDRAKVFQLQCQLAKQGMAVQPVYLAPDGLFQLEYWQPFCTYQAEQRDNHQALAKLGQALARVHRLSIAAAVLDLPQVWQHYLAVAAVEKQAPINTEVTELTRHLSRQPQRKKVFCHHDLSFSHLPVAATPLLFDWEYAAMGDPYFDLVSCLAINQLNEGASQVVMQAYAEAMGMTLATVQQGCQQQRPYVDLTSRLWYLAAAKSTG